jgi:hypothetical protein
MNEHVKDILNFHTKKNPGAKLVKVTLTRWYEIPATSSEDHKELMQEWFDKYPSTRPHAYRDHSLLVEYFNGDHRIVDKDSLE